MTGKATVIVAALLMAASVAYAADTTAGTTSTDTTAGTTTTTKTDLYPFPRSTSPELSSDQIAARAAAERSKVASKQKVAEIKARRARPVDNSSNPDGLSPLSLKLKSGK